MQFVKIAENSFFLILLFYLNFREIHPRTVKMIQKVHPKGKKDI